MTGRSAQKSPRRRIVPVAVGELDVGEAVGVHARRYRGAPCHFGLVIY